MTCEYKEIIELQPIKKIVLYSGGRLYETFEEPIFTPAKTLIIENGYATIAILADNVHAGKVGRNWDKSYLILQNIDVLWHVTFQAEVFFENYKCSFDEVNLISWSKNTIGEKMYGYYLVFSGSNHKITNL